MGVRDSGSESETYENYIERQLLKEKPVDKALESGGPRVDSKASKVSEALERIVNSTKPSLEDELARKMLQISPPQRIAQVVDRVVSCDPASYVTSLTQELAKEAQVEIGLAVCHVMSNGAGFPSFCVGDSREAFMNLYKLGMKGKRPFEDYSMENRSWQLDHLYKPSEAVSDNRSHF